MKRPYVLLFAALLAMGCSACSAKGAKQPEPASAPPQPAASASEPSQPASPASEPSQPAQALVQGNLVTVAFPTGQGEPSPAETAPVKVSLALPEGWSVKAPADTADRGMEFYQEDVYKGRIDLCPFEPMARDSAPAGDYYKTVYPELRLSRACVWDPYTPVKGEDGVAETGVATVMRTDLENAQPGKLAQAPTIESVGILSYDCALKAYAAIEFAADTVTHEQAQALAQSVTMTAA